MDIRTTRSKATFAAPFRLPEVAEVLPAGTYDIETDEQIIEGNEHTIHGFDVRINKYPADAAS